MPKKTSKTDPEPSVEPATDQPAPKQAAAPSGSGGDAKIVIRIVKDTPRTGPDGSGPIYRRGVRFRTTEAELAHLKIPTDCYERD